MNGISRYSLGIVAIAAGCLGLLAGEQAFGQVLRGEAAMGNWRDDKPGVRRLLTLRDLPAVAKPTYGVAQVVPMPAGAPPPGPEGFSAGVGATGLHKPRGVRVAPHGGPFGSHSNVNSGRG